MPFTGAPSGFVNYDEVLPHLIRRRRSEQRMREAQRRDVERQRQLRDHIRSSTDPARVAALRAWARAHRNDRSLVHRNFMLVRDVERDRPVEITNADLAELILGRQ